MGGLDQSEAQPPKEDQQMNPPAPPATVPIENEVRGPSNPLLSQNDPSLDEDEPTVSANFMDNLSPGM